MQWLRVHFVVFANGQEEQPEAKVKGRVGEAGQRATEPLAKARSPHFVDWPRVLRP